jgi:hypothetical protein
LLFIFLFLMDIHRYGTIRPIYSSYAVGDRTRQQLKLQFLLFFVSFRLFLLLLTFILSSFFYFLLGTRLHNNNGTPTRQGNKRIVCRLETIMVVYGHIHQGGYISRNEIMEQDAVASLYVVPRVLVCLLLDRYRPCHES